MAIPAPGAFRCTLLVDTRGRRPGLILEPGFSLLVESADTALLLDAGTSRAWSTNLEMLGLAEVEVRHLILSHGHVDHSGGLPTARAQWPQAQLWCHPSAPRARWSLYKDHPPRSLGMSKSARRALEEALPHPVEGRVDLTPNLSLIGPPETSLPEEARSGPFFLDPDGGQPDPFDDELTLVLHTPQGLVVILGCCHRGVISTLDHVLATTGVPKLRAVVGGFHLAKAGKGRLAFTAEGLRRLGSPALYPCHCTGQEACDVLPNVVQPLIAGDSLTLA